MADAWMRALAGTGFTPLPTAEFERLVNEHVAALTGALRAERDTAVRAARSAGAAVVDARFVDAEGLRASLHVLGPGLLRIAEADGEPDPVGRVNALLGEFGAGYAAAFRDWLFDQQEEVKLAFQRANGEVERRLRRSEARFREMFVRSAIGIAISDAGGKLAQVNPALAEILGCPADELVGRSLDEFCHPQDGMDLRADYHELTGLGGRPLRRRRRLVRPDGQLVWAYLAVSVLHDVDEMPTLHLTMVENVSDLHLLQDLASHQSLHDLGTGLPNRQYLVTQLQAQLAGPDGEPGDGTDPARQVTLFQLDLDGFTAINHGVGPEAADRLLTVVARRLESLFAGRRVLVARLAGDEFAVLFRAGCAPAEVLATVGQINEQLAEPVHLPDGDIGGIGLSVSIGVAHGQLGETDPAELLRRADATLRRAQATGHRQWAEYDRHRDVRHRRRAALAVTLSGALEFGELTVRWRPWLSLRKDGRVAGISACAGWDHPEYGPIDHDECRELAEMTGAAVPFAAWLIGVGAEQARVWWERFGDNTPPVGIALTASQVADPDLVGTVGAAIQRTGVRPDLLCLGVPTRASARYENEVRDNLGLLTGMGVRIVLGDAGVAPMELLLAEEWPVDAVQVAESLVRDLAAADPGSRLARTTAAMVRTLREVDLRVVVPGVCGVAAADWWRAAGAWAASGAHFGAPVPADRMTTRLAAGRPGM